MKQPAPKLYYVHFIGRSTRCDSLDDALEYYRSMCPLYKDLALEEYNCFTGHSRYVRHKGVYSKNF